MEMEYQGAMKSKDRVGANPYTEDWDPPQWDWLEAVLLAIDHFFCIVFLVELMLRIIAFRLRFFWIWSNWLDFVIVVGAVFELYILGLFGLNLPDLTMTRLLRLFRLVKILRVVRGMRSVRPLRLLLISIWSSISTLLWSIIFLCTIQ